MVPLFGNTAFEPRLLSQGAHFLPKDKKLQRFHDLGDEPHEIRLAAHCDLEDLFIIGRSAFDTAGHIRAQ